MKRELYLDTSIISAFFDYEKPIRQLITEKWFQHESKHYSLYISEIVIEEIGKTKDDILRERMFGLLNKINPISFEITNEIKFLAKFYRKSILPKEVNDTLHLACASCYGLDNIASWNFKHIVNGETMKAIHQVNLSKGYGIVEIVSLLNLGGDKYGNL